VGEGVVDDVETSGCLGLGVHDAVHAGFEDGLGFIVAVEATVGEDWPVVLKGLRPALIGIMLVELGTSFVERDIEHIDAEALEQALLSDSVEIHGGKS